ncbi:MAG TPA: tetratricopeptide repeat protein [Candidatus Acidoferrales bacterium]|jgi:tetratricopeptide (TPR) repeat protein|nr:tetratricopeptide repeat protein [Candidatus Acidoferrales bacterium]
MAYNKTKHLNAAQKYLQQGKMPQAILEYQQILKNEPKDQVTLMTLGDLFVRQGDTFQALEYFERLAKIFLNDGFTTKAIAIYKKVAKLAPEESRPLERLAELYVQQGVLSEARPLYLQLAEMQLKAGRQPQAALLLRKLLEAEPDNLRVQVRLAELHLSMGQQKEAIETFYGAAQKLHEQGDHVEAIRLADRILELDSLHKPTFQLKVHALNAAGKSAEAGKILETLPDRDEGGETTSMLLNLYMESGQIVQASQLAEKVYARDPKQFAVPLKITGLLLDTGNLDRAQDMLDLVRNSMIDAGEHEPLAQLLTRLAENKPGKIEPIEWLVDLYGRASDSFRLPDALAQLAAAYESAGDEAKALATYEKLLERTPEDETTRRKYMRLRSKSGLEPISSEIASVVKVVPTNDAAQPVSIKSSDPALDEETERYVTQALTDVDLFSSYGLAQKAIDLLESVLDRAPRHAPILERLLDLSVGSGNSGRIAELASILEQIAKEQNDRAGVERYAELRRRFQPGAGATSEGQESSAQPAQAAAPEFAVPVIRAELDESAEQAQPEAEFSVPAQIPEPVEVESSVHEVDLSDEWAALSQQLETAMMDEPKPAFQQSALPQQKMEIPAPVLVPAQAVQSDAEATSQIPGYDFELQAAEPVGVTQSDTHAADSMISDLAGDLDSYASSLGISNVPPLPAPKSSIPAPVEPTTKSSAKPTSGNGATAPVSSGSLEGPLGDLFEEFRSELGEKKEDEDLETHYNLGIAYREMGLLEEAISEFQKVASSLDKGPAFRYAMQCSTLLGLAFMEKGQPAIAAIWYERALKTPGLDQESILALRYDLGVAQELAGDEKAAFNSFSQVYALNIDYRDVSERIALLGKAR